MSWALPLVGAGSAAGHLVSAVGRPGVSLSKNSHAGGVAMEKIAAADWSDLALRKKPGDRNRPQPSRHGLGVVIDSSEEALPAPAATEDQCAERIVTMRCAIGGE